MHKSYRLFISSLIGIFGNYDVESKKFANQSNSVIARELFYSDSQFSRLINQTASEGEYERANKIITRYRENLDLKKKLKTQRHKQGPSLSDILQNKYFLLIFFMSTITSLLVGAKFLGYKDVTEQRISPAIEMKMDHMLYWAFELSDVKSYTELNDLPSDCIYPCYRLQGKWNIKNEYKLPVFGEQRGFHYVAKEVNMYARCMSENNNNGKDLEGYEYQKHEIWYDIEELLIDSFLIGPGSPVLTENYQAKVFSEEENFILVANVHTFFRNEFHINEHNIERRGKVIGRYIEYEDLSNANSKITHLSIAEIENEISNIVNIRVEDFSKPIQCENAKFEKTSVYDIEENDILKFECTMTTGRFPILYEKRYILADQIIKNLCRPEQ